MNTTFLSAKWEHLIMANYTVNPILLEPFLPKGVELDDFNDKVFVSLVGFLFKNTRLFNIPIPFLGTFEEINLRFYVKRKDGNNYKRGVVFINETVPYKPVAYIANKLYKEHYISIPTKSKINFSASNKTIQYDWRINNAWNKLYVNTSIGSAPMMEGSIEEFIFEHYFGYTRINNEVTQEYKVNHPRWLINQVIDYSIECDFKAMYGTEFEYLKDATPHSVIVAEGSSVTVDWKRIQI
jgi:uncharacterized protein